MKIDKVKMQMRKGVLEYCILSVINNKDAYASDVIEILKNSGLIIVEGTLYPLLTRLKNEGFLEYRWEESTQGPPRKYYKLTSTGKKLIGEMHNAWDELVTAVESVTKNN